jgi:hypothetical protein
MRARARSRWQIVRLTGSLGGRAIALYAELFQLQAAAYA